MKIIKQGLDLNFNLGYELTCQICECVFQCDNSETHWSNTWDKEPEMTWEQRVEYYKNTVYNYAHCPNCTCAVRIKPENYRKRPKQ